MSRQGILERLKTRPVVGDGSYAVTLEHRGYTLGGVWTPEAVLEYPGAVRELHREFMRAGSEVLQAMTYNGSDSRLQRSDHLKSYTNAELNKAACEIVFGVAKGGDVLVSGGLSPLPSYITGEGEKTVKDEFSKQCQTFLDLKVDFLLGEFFGHVEEAVWAIECMKQTGLPVACTMRVGPSGDLHNISPGQCAVRMARAGADILGLNCQYDPFICLKTIKLMKEALDKEGLSPYLMIQPLGYLCPEVEHTKGGYHELPEFPFALDPRVLTRWDVRRYTREAYNIGVRYFGGCCGFEPYHIREIAEEFAEERGWRPGCKDKHAPFGAGLASSVYGYLHQRTGRDYWMNVRPGTGRPGQQETSMPEFNLKNRQQQGGLNL